MRDITTETTVTFQVVKPNRAEMDRVLRSQEDLPYSYPEVGFTLDSEVEKNPVLRRQYRFLHRRTFLGEGNESFVRAKKAILAWQMFNLEWLQFCCWDRNMTEGGTVAILGRTIGVWWLNPCRIISLIDNEGPVERFGFAYGTLSSNAVRGEERILVEWDRRDDRIHYDLFSFSCANLWISQLNIVYLRHLQDRFGRESGQAMARYIHGG